MKSRRQFIRLSALGTALASGLYPLIKVFAAVPQKSKLNAPVVIST
ncbi:MAG: twin-arginine translocation signal domain-containing protein [Rufibacter sp.]